MRANVIASSSTRRTSTIHRVRVRRRETKVMGERARVAGDAAAAGEESARPGRMRIRRRPPRDFFVQCVRVFAFITTCVIEGHGEKRREVTSSRRRRRRRRSSGTRPTADMKCSSRTTDGFHKPTHFGHARNASHVCRARPAARRTRRLGSSHAATADARTKSRNGNTAAYAHARGTALKASSARSRLSMPIE